VCGASSTATARSEPGATRDVTVTTSVVAMTDPKFAFGYDRTLDDGTMVEAGLGNMKTLEQLTGYFTVSKLHPESRRRHFAVYLFAYERGIAGGPGTGYRTPDQQAAGSNNAPVWSSWHQGESPAKDTNALAVDNVPSSFQHWWGLNQATITQRFGLIIYRTSSNPDAWNHQGRPYSASSQQEWWHSQPWEVNYGRGRYTYGPWNLRHWDIEDKYDIDVVGLRFWEHPLWGGVVTPDPEPPIPPEPELPIPPTPIPPPPTGVYEVTNAYRSTVVDGSRGKMAKFCQQQINLIAGQGIAEDGDFGSQSVQALKNVQTVLGVTPDGQCGPKTWQALENAIRTQAERGDWS
jgi:hypothetical protein